MEDQLSLTLSDNLLYTVLGCCGVNSQYMMPLTSPRTQSSFDENFGTDVIDICCLSWNTMESELGRVPMFSNLTHEDFDRGVASFRAIFPSFDQSFVLMLHVAMMAAFFIRTGIERARFWAFEIIHRQARVWMHEMDI